MRFALFVIIVFLLPQIVAADRMCLDGDSILIRKRCKKTQTRLSLEKLHTAITAQDSCPMGVEGLKGDKGSRGPIGKEGAQGEAGFLGNGGSAGVLASDTIPSGKIIFGVLNNYDSTSCAFDGDESRVATSFPARVLGNAVVVVKAVNLPNCVDGACIAESHRIDTDLQNSCPGTAVEPVNPLQKPGTICVYPTLTNNIKNLGPGLCPTQTGFHVRYEYFEDGIAGFSAVWAYATP